MQPHQAAVPTDEHLGWERGGHVTTTTRGQQDYRVCLAVPLGLAARLAIEPGAGRVEGGGDPAEVVLVPVSLHLAATLPAGE